MSQMRKLFGGYVTAVPVSLAVLSVKRDEGQTLAEYALILAFIAVVCVVIVATLGNTISGFFSSASSAI